MNDRGQYGIPLYGGSLYSNSPWGGAPDMTDSGWPYRGPQAFHGHEAPTFGRHGAWPPRRGAPLGRGGLIIGENDRGQYGSVSVGEGSIFPHTPGEVEDELDQLHGEIMQFGQEVSEKEKLATIEQLASNPEVQQFRAEEDAAYAYLKTIPEKAAGRIEAVKRAKEASDKRAAAEHRSLTKPPLLEWDRTVWKPFLNAWINWRSAKKDIALQLWPMSGTWDHIQDQRQKFIDIRANAPFKSAGPKPRDPQHDPSLTGFFEEIAKLGKWGLIGILGIGGVIALSSVALNLKKGSDPADKYVGLLRERRAARTGLPRATASMASGEIK